MGGAAAIEFSGAVQVVCEVKASTNLANGVKVGAAAAQDDDENKPIPGHWRPQRAGYTGASQLAGPERAGN